MNIPLHSFTPSEFNININIHKSVAEDVSSPQGNPMAARCDSLGAIVSNALFLVTLRPLSNLADINMDLIGNGADFATWADVNIHAMKFFALSLVGSIAGAIVPEISHGYFNVYEQMKSHHTAIAETMRGFAVNNPAYRAQVLARGQERNAVESILRVFNPSQDVPAVNQAFTRVLYNATRAMLTRANEITKKIDPHADFLGDFEAWMDEAPLAGLKMGLLHLLHKAEVDPSQSKVTCKIGIESVDIEGSALFGMRYKLIKLSMKVKTLSGQEREILENLICAKRYVPEAYRDFAPYLEAGCNVIGNEEFLAANDMTLNGVKNWFAITPPSNDMGIRGLRQKLAAWFEPLSVEKAQEFIEYVLYRKKFDDFATIGRGFVSFKVCEQKSIEEIERHFREIPEANELSQWFGSLSIEEKQSYIANITASLLHAKIDTMVDSFNKKLVTNEELRPLWQEFFAGISDGNDEDNVEQESMPLTVQVEEGIEGPQ